MSQCTYRKLWLSHYSYKLIIDFMFFGFGSVLCPEFQTALADDDESSDVKPSLTYHTGANDASNSQSKAPLKKGKSYYRVLVPQHVFYSLFKCTLSGNYINLKNKF